MENLLTNAMHMMTADRSWPESANTLDIHYAGNWQRELEISCRWLAIVCSEMRYESCSDGNCPLFSFILVHMHVWKRFCRLCGIEIAVCKLYEMRFCLGKGNLSVLFISESSKTQQGGTCSKLTCFWRDEPNGSE